MPLTQPKPALFLDRDGVVNVDYGHVQNPADFHFVDGIIELCVAANKAGYLTVIVTNQAGIARGYYSELQMSALHEWMRQEIGKKGAVIDAIYHCPFHPDAVIEELRVDSYNRKPNPGMILQAAEELGLDLGSSILIGDKDTDIEAGMRAGVGKLILLQQTLPAELTRTSFGLQCGSIHKIIEFLLRTVWKSHQAWA
jgi:D-glycero-D-manno-heptose 1,7-bisphosphate phosphatase